MKRNGLLYVLAFSVLMLLCRAGSTSAGLSSVANDLVVGDEIHYHGDIGGALPVGMVLHFEPDAQRVSGCYFYERNCTDIRLDGTLNGRHIEIREFDAKGKQTGRFVGQFAQSDPRHHYGEKEQLKREVIVGEWSRPDGSKPKPFYLNENFSSSHPAPGKNEYSVAGFNDQAAVDRVASRFRNALLKHDVDAAVELIQFPLNVFVDGKGGKIDEAQFRREYDHFISPAYVQQIAATVPVHMFARDQGVMLGNGDVWIAPAKAGDDASSRIISLNCDDKIEATDCFGDWRVTKHLNTDNVTAMDDKEADTWIGARASYARDSAKFDGPRGSVECKGATYTIHTISDRDFYEDYRIHLDSIGITGDYVTYVEIANKEGNWHAPGNMLIFKAHGTLITCEKGVFFEMARNDPK